MGGTPVKKWPRFSSLNLKSFKNMAFKNPGGEMCSGWEVTSLFVIYDNAASRKRREIPILFLGIGKWGNLGKMGSNLYFFN